MATVELPAGKIYLLLGDADLSISHTSIMSAGFAIKSGSGNMLSGNKNVRTIADSGGGCVCWGIFQTITDCVVNLNSYGYFNGTYNIRGNIAAIILEVI